jgi:hypothetical protein
MLRLKYLGMQVRRMLPCERSSVGVNAFGALGSVCSLCLLRNTRVGYNTCSLSEVLQK